MTPTPRVGKQSNQSGHRPHIYCASLLGLICLLVCLLFVVSCQSDRSAKSEPQPPNAKEATPIIDGVALPGEYENSKTISTVEVSWSVEGKNLRIAVSAPCTGYVSVGFDPENRKEGGNYIIGYVKDGITVVRDHVGTRGNLHAADIDLGGTDDILEFAGTEINERTTLEFIIPLDSGDRLDQPLVPGSKHVILVAFQDSRDDLISIHSRHGVAQVDL